MKFTTKTPHVEQDWAADFVLALRLREPGKERNQRREYQSVYYIKYRFRQQQKELRPEMGEEPSVHGLRVRRHGGEYLAEAREALAGRKAVQIRPVVHRVRREDVSEQHEKKNSEEQRSTHSPGADRRHGAGTSGSRRTA